MKRVKKVAILYTGGTIGCKKDYKGSLKPVEGEQFCHDVSQIVTKYTESCGIEPSFYHLPENLDSSNIRPNNWFSMAIFVLNQYNSFDGFVILHGTDTMSWSASALSFLLTDLNKPVIFTGSQISIYEYRNDGYKNLITAITLAGTTSIPEVCLLFDTLLLRGNRSTKSHAIDFKAFSSPNYPPLGNLGINIDINRRQILPFPQEEKRLQIEKNLSARLSMLKTMQTNLNRFSVVALSLFPGIEVSTIRAVIDQTSPELKGMVLKTFGTGNAPTNKQFLETLNYANEKGITLVDCTQTFAGGVEIDTYETGKKLKEHGVISGHDLTQEAALTKLIYLISMELYNSDSSGLSYDKLRVEEGIKTVIAGEIKRYYGLEGGENEYLLAGDSLYSKNGEYKLIYDSRGYLSLYSLKDEKLLWQVPEKSRVNGAGRAYMQPDGNFVVSDLHGAPLWSSKTAGHLESRLILEDSGRVAIYNRAGILLWHNR